MGNIEYVVIHMCLHGFSTEKKVTPMLPLGLATDFVEIVEIISKFKNIFFMLATCALKMCLQTQQLSGLKCHSVNLNAFWPTAEQMMNCPIMIRPAHSNQGFSIFIKTVDEPLRESKTKWCIGCGISLLQMQTISDKHGTWLDKVGYKSDYVTITGLLNKNRDFIMLMHFV